MRTFALVGKTGTGKSYHALELAREYGIESVIDDGLLISGNKILAGSSAKHEATKIASVKRAIFLDELQQTAVKDAMAKNNLDSVLILGTSEKMVHLIASRLELPPFERIFTIEEIATPKEIQTAGVMRNRYGKHIIPAPVFEVKKQFSGYFLKSLFTQNLKDSEKTVMRPTYSYMGSFRISPKVFSDICHYELSKIDKISDVIKVKSITSSNGCIQISVDVGLEFPCDIPKTARVIQDTVAQKIEDSTSIVVEAVNVFVKYINLA